MANNNSIRNKKQHITQLKNNQTRIQRLFTFDEKIKNKICDCGRYIYINTKLNIISSEIKKEVEQAYTCQYRYCPLCNYYRICTISPQMIKALEQEQAKGNKILFLTLTVPNCKYLDIRQTISNMNKAYAKLIRQDFFKFIEAWIRTTEVTFNLNTLWLVESLINLSIDHFPLPLITNVKQINAQNRGYSQPP